MNRKAFVLHLVTLLFFISLGDALLSLGLQQMLVSINVNISSFGSVSYSNATSNPFGVQVWWYSNLAYQMEKVAELGVGWIRIDAWWPGLEPEQGQYNFDMMDTMVNLARSYGIKPLLTAENVPDWANGGKGEKAPPTDMTYYKDFVKTLVNRYSLDIIELSNEPQYGFSGTDQQYVDFIHAGYDGAKEADHNCIVIAGYAGGEIMQIYNDPYNLDSLVNKGFLNYIDGLVIHPYTWSTLPEDKIPGEIDYLKDYLAPKGKGDLPLYATEFGYSLKLHSEEEQADWTIWAAQILKDKGCKVNIYYCFWGSNPDEARDMVEPGYPDPDLSNPRPVYYAYQNFITNL
jgi:hypothetical protein